MKPLKHKKRWIFLSASLILILSAILVALDDTLTVVSYSIKSKQITAPVRIALLTDLHSCQYGEDEIELIQALDAQKPDVVLLGGDIFDHIIPHQNGEALLKGIADRYPCYYVTGNHEYWSREVDSILSLIASYPVTILQGTYDTIEVRGQTINICGISDPDLTRYTDSNFDMKQQLESLQSALENDRYTVLLTHRPEEIQLYLQYDFDLILSGHAHGGQWRIPGIINGVYAPNQGLFPKYAGGRYEFSDTTMIVSRGLAKETTRIPRIFNRPELVIVDLTAAET